MTHLGVPETFTEQMRIIEGTQCERAEQRPVFRGFCHLCKVPVGNTYCTLNFQGCRKKVCSSDLLQSADILECREKRMWSVLRAFFKDTSAFTLVAQRRLLVIRYLKHQHRK